MFKRTSKSGVIGLGLLVQAPALAFACLGCADAPGAQVRNAGAGDRGRHDAAADGVGSSGTGAGAYAQAEAGGQAQAGTSGEAAAGQAGAKQVDSRLERATVEADDVPKIDAPSYNQLIAQLNQFGLELGRKHAEANDLTEKNSVFSPLSVSIVLSMTYAGARGATAAELKTVLGAGLSANTYHAGIDRLVRELASRARSGTDSNGNLRKVELNIADALYVDGMLDVEPSFLDLLARNYDTGVHRADFRHAYEVERGRINDWVATETHDKIQNLLPIGALSDRTRFVLVNALYFYGTWRDTFQPEATQDAEFHTLANDSVTVKRMHRVGSMRYTAGSDFAAVELPYVGEQLSMLLVVPNAGQFESVRKVASAQWLKSVLDNGVTQPVRLGLPKFKLTVGSFSLIASLKDLGLKTVLSGAADFTGISADEPLQISDVIQKAFIAVDENATEAAAATAVVGGVASASNDVVQLHIDRPFLFFVRDESGVVLFSGQVVDPSKSE